ncbi:formimidoylglutamase [Flavobacterium sp. xlx-214]|uniref:formimidoylglutamase n=1 Tax=unclassified Flavobacterium TaxID=196869 RepID=UPI0013D6143C|nr:MULTISPECIES: formimidoylglutamase [unclassified Flavobacterium]MBA5791342.1 formimidoylglutamase [Flavobacterium sp. xlx-221]QMI83502.1 formimidoylglutamase [Flavobacterium sp. xlx-214]
MENLRYFNKIELDTILSVRLGETKLGEKVKYNTKNLTDISEVLTDLDCDYIVYGIKEFVGIKANFGKPGTKHAWDVFLPTFLNIQNNTFLKGKKIGILGFLDYSQFDEELLNLSPNYGTDLERLTQIVSLIDKDVTYLNTLIHKSGKKPIVIGGGHNNAYGNIKGLALAKGAAVNVVNFDAHTDFRALEGRHSGNGFSYAFNEGFVKTYCAFGVHENYLNKYMLQQFKEHWDQLKMFTFDEMKVRFEKEFRNSINNAHRLIKNTTYGIEIDIDAIENTASSAMTPCGFSSTEARQFVSLMANHSNASYLHICEGSPSLSTLPENLLGKLYTYLVSDFIKAQINILR